MFLNLGFSLGTDAHPPTAVSRYKADSSLQVRPETALSPPSLNQVFRDPDFGSRMVRVTDQSGIRGDLTGFSFVTNASAETNEWGKFDPKLGSHGGYYFYVTHSGGGAVFFMMDAVTMQVTPVCSPSSCRVPIQGNFSYTEPDLVYGQFERTGTLLDAYHIATGKQSRVYDFSRCPNIPGDLSGYSGSVSNSGDDTKFAIYLGGRMQGFTTLVAYYDRSTNRCYWYDTATGTVGGSQMANAVSTVEMLPPPRPPTLKAVGGDLPAGDYFVKITASTRLNPAPGETMPSAETHISLTSPGGIKVFPPTLDNPYHLEVVGYSVYIGDASGKETQQAALLPLRSPYLQSSKLISGASAPTFSRAGHNVHNARLSLDGKVIEVNSQQSGGMSFWIPGTTTVSTCSSASYCTGHTVLGYSHMVNHGGPGRNTSLLLRPLSDLDRPTQLLPTNPGVPANMDTHWSWNDADPSDSMPVCGAFSRSSSRIQGDGTQKPTNPLLAIQQPWDREIVCVATTGPPTIWRFAHHRATGACNSNARDGSCFGAIAIGNVSQDGKFYLFSSDWEWSLGGNGCPNRGGCRVDSFIVELK